LAARGICGGCFTTIKKSYTLRRYFLLNKAWSKHPPADFLVAAYLGYKAPESEFEKAINNTKQMFDVMMYQRGNKIASAS